MKRLFGLMLALAVAIAPSLASAKSYRYSGGRSRSHRTYSSSSWGSKSWRTPKYAKMPALKSCYRSYSSGTSWSGMYKSSGLSRVNRSESARRGYLESLGYDKVPAGYEVDHVVPLSRGGADEPYNMQLLPASVHHQKTAREQSR